MPTFDKREEAFEKRFAHDEEIQFKANARRNKLLGLWAADLMGRKGADAESYARSVVEADFQHAGHEDVFLKIKTDLAAANVDRSDHQIRRTMDELLDTAKQQIQTEVKD